MRAAAEAAERQGLQRRYEAARAEAAGRGVDGEVMAFEAVLASSVMVNARPLGDIERLASSDRQGVATYERQLEAGLRLPDREPWNRLRRLAGDALFTDYADKVHFASVSLDGTGVENYGEAWLQLRSHCVDHRASAFTSNSATFMQAISYNQSAAIGHRSTWDERHKVAIAKLAASITTGATSADLSGLLTRQRATSVDDEFVEVQIYGSMTVCTIERVLLSKSALVKRGQEKRVTPARLEGLRDDLARFDVAFEERP